MITAINTTVGQWLNLTNPGGNYATNGYPTRAPSPLIPSAVTTGVTAAGDGVLPVGDQGGSPGAIASAEVDLIPVSVGTSGDTYSFTVLGWAATKLGGVILWVPVPLGIFQATAGTTTGVAGTDLPVTTLFATTITQSYGPVYGTTPTDSPEAAATGGAVIFTPGSNAIAMVTILTRGFRFLEIIYDTGGVATSCNALWLRR